ncbi:hypothetical protein BY458DRAFT_491207 [Sporodiniella umbellata]|nr:hypothetical protein BY458DRAFT_491207 [Sporodiniella umbellata]
MQKFNLEMSEKTGFCAIIAGVWILDLQKASGSFRITRILGVRIGTRFTRIATVVLATKKKLPLLREFFIVARPVISSLEAQMSRIFFDKRCITTKFALIKPKVLTKKKAAYFLKIAYVYFKILFLLKTLHIHKKRQSDKTYCTKIIKRQVPQTLQGYCIKVLGCTRFISSF